MFRKGIFEHVIVLTLYSSSQILLLPLFLFAKLHASKHSHVAEGSVNTPRHQPTQTTVYSTVLWTCAVRNSPPQRTLCHTVEVEVKEFGQHQNHLQSETRINIHTYQSQDWGYTGGPVTLHQCPLLLFVLDQYHLDYWPHSLHLLVWMVSLYEPC